MSDDKQLVVREKCIDKLVVILKKGKIASPKTVARKIEAAVYQFTLTSIADRGVVFDWSNAAIRRSYGSKMMSILQNLDPHSAVGNTYLIGKLYEGTICPENIPYMNPQELFPERWETLVMKRIKEYELASMEVGAIDTTKVCSKCMTHGCYSVIRQTRSGDEGSTTFFRCTNKDCGHQWRES